ncbi:hypothetical protein ABTK13_22070, partial [Acinetobacter baumannii]
LLIDLRRKATVRQGEAMLNKFKDKQFGQIIVSRNPSDYQNFSNVVLAIDYAEKGKRINESGGQFVEWRDRHGK